MRTALLFNNFITASVNSNKIIDKNICGTVLGLMYLQNHGMRVSAGKLQRLPCPPRYRCVGGIWVREMFPR